MSFDVKRNAWAVGCALICGVFAPGSARAEPDVLERPALTRVAERAVASVMLGLGRAGARLVAVGERGMILLSDDGGARWQQAAVPVSVTLTSVHFADAQHGWAAGHSGVVLGTTDGGQSWTKLLDGKLAAARVAEEAKKPGASPAFAAEAERLVADGPDKPFLAIHFRDARHGLVAGAYGLLFSTADGGRTWQPLQARLDNPRGLHLYSIHDAGDALYIAGEQGALFVSRNGGSDFESLPTPYPGSYFGVLGSGGTLLVFGMRGNAWWSADQGASWHRSAVPGPNTLTAGTVLDGGRIVLVDDAGNVLASEDGGRSFAPAGLAKLTPLNAVAAGAGGGLVVAGVRGLARPVPSHASADDRK